MKDNNCRPKQSDFGFLENRSLNLSQPDVRIAARPSAESLQLAFRLAHPRVEKVELSERGCSGFSVAVNRIKPKHKKHQLSVRPFASLVKKPLVMFDKADNVVLSGSLDEFNMMRQELRCGLRNQYVHASLDSIHCDREVSGC